MVLVSGQRFAAPVLTLIFCVLRRLSERSKCSESTCGHRACTAVARAAMPLRARLDSAWAVAWAARRYRPMNSELWQLIPDRWLLAHVSAAPSRLKRHRQREWSRTARISGGRTYVGRRRSGRLLSQHFVARDDCPKNATSPSQLGGL